MHRRSIVRMLSLPMLGLGLLLGCDSGATTSTTTAPTGHDGSAHGPTSAPADPGAAKHVGPRR